MELELRINGIVESLDIAPNETLLTMLRREGYCSVKNGCETGECGACSVLVDGEARPSCVMLAAQAGGCTLTTVESLGTPQKLHPLQQAFIDVGAIQCGFCTPGMLLSAYALLKRTPAPTEDEARDALSGNLCRCMGYAKPVQAVMRAAASMRGETVAPVTYHVINQEEEHTDKHAVVTLKAKADTQEHVASRVVVGQPVPNSHAAKLVTGKATFAGDLNLHTMLYACILTSPHAHAVIRSIDVTQAKALPGVHAVLTYKNIPRVPYASIEHSPLEAKLQDQYCLDYIVRYIGDRVAVVAAETLEIAEEALSLIEVDYEVQPSVLDLRQASKSESPRLHPESESSGIYDATHNIAARVRIEQGDVKRGFAEADLVVEGEYVVPPMQEVPLENHTVVTYFDEDDYLVVRTSTQAPHHIRRTLAHVLNVSASRIRVIKPEIGGGMGVKQEIVLEDLCALLTIATNRPVMLAYSRAEEFTSSRVRQQYVIRLKTGVKSDGKLIANQAVLLTSTGAYGTHPLIGHRNAVAHALSLYPCPNMSYIAEVVYTNHPPSGAYGGYGAPQEFFALESHMDEIAKQLHMDALMLRRKNWIKAGDEYPLAGKLQKGNEQPPSIGSCGLEQCLQIVEEQLHWKEKRDKAGSERLRRGVGVAISLHGNPADNTNTSGAIIKLNEDGSCDVFAGANTSGSGSTTLLTQMAAEIVGVSVESIFLHSSGTDTVPFEAGAHASTVLYASGGAIQKAAEQVRHQLLAMAGKMLHAVPESLKISAGTITTPDNQTTTVEQVAVYALHIEGRQIMSTASWKVLHIPTSFAAQGVEVEVDSETGSVRVLKTITAVDAGRVMNPLVQEGQIEGSTTLGLGASVWEEMMYDQQGKALTTSLNDYHISNALDMPEMQTYLVETNDTRGPFGIKAVAEISLQGMAPAIANAVADAQGIRMRVLPLRAERVLRAIYAQEQGSKER